ncbi:MAG: glycosyltransferase 87 family protein [Anaerolineae bacterium]
MRSWRRYLPIVALFVALRLMVMATFPPDNLTLYGDYIYYYELAATSDQGYLPFIHYWSEYPPVFPFLSVGVYQLTHLFGGGYHVYVYLMGGLMLAVNTGNLVLFLRLAQRLRGAESVERLGWIYSTLFVPLMYTWWNFDALTLFFLLLALELLLSGHEHWSAVAMGVGALVKLVPLLLFPAVVRTRPWRRWFVYGVVVAAVIGAVTLPLLLAGGQMAWVSFLSPTGWSSWQTVWALLDGNLRTGLLVAPSDHFDPAMAMTPVGNPARVPAWVTLLAFALIYTAIFWKARLRESPRRLVSFVCTTFLLFFLWSKGWSPQWQVLLFPLLLLVLPIQRGVLFILTLSFVNLAEWPVLLSRGLDQWLYLTVPLRTALLVLLLIETVKREV